MSRSDRTRPSRARSLALCAILVAGCGSEVDRLADQLREGEVEQRRAASRRLGELGPEAVPAVPALAASLDDPDDEVRRTGARALGRVGPAAAPAVDDLKRMLDHADQSNRLTAAYALVEIVPDDPAPLDVLTAAAAREDPRAIIALGQLGTTAGPALPLLRRLARSSRDIVRSKAAEAVNLVGGE